MPEIDITALSPEQRQALACMFFAMLPKADPRYKERKHCFEVFQKRFNKKPSTYKNAKDAFDANFDSNGRIGWAKDRSLERRGQAYKEVYDLYKDYTPNELEPAVRSIIALYEQTETNYIALRGKEENQVRDESCLILCMYMK